MRFQDWEPVYEAILADFGYDRTGDEGARDVLEEMIDYVETDRFPDLTARTVAVVGAGPSLDDDLDTVRDADRVVAASSAARTCLDAGIDVDWLVTDLDGHPPTARELTERGVPVAVHAHGDNVPALREHVPMFRAGLVFPTTQAEPAGHVRNVGGFTDGDRAAFLADHFGAGRLTFPGWDFDDPAVGSEKRRKLRWAERLLYWLERRRDERFDVLDGRRDGIDTSSLPV